MSNVKDRFYIPPYSNAELNGLAKISRAETGSGPKLADLIKAAELGEKAWHDHNVSVGRRC